MSNLDWNLAECKKAELRFDGDCTDLDSFVNKVASLIDDQNLSSIKFVVPLASCCLDLTKKVVDSIAELLKANPNIETMQVDSRSNNGQAREYLLQVLAEGIAGDSLEYLWIDDESGEISVEETGFLVRNRNLRRLRFDATGATGLQLASCLPRSLKSLCLDVWQCRGMGELGAALGRCSSILSLRLVLYEDHLTEVESFFRGIGPLRSLTHLEVELQFHMSAVVIDALGYFIVQQQGTLAHFAIDAQHTNAVESWKGLGLSLCSTVKRVSLRICSQDALLAVLPQLQSCESLELVVPYRWIRPILEVASRLPNLRDLALNALHSIHIEGAILDMIKSSNSIAAVQIKRGTTPSAFQRSMDSFCILNRVFGTSLVSFGPTDLWTSVLSRVSNGSARTTLLYRLLREKPEMIIGSSTQSPYNSI